MHFNVKEDKKTHRGNISKIESPFLVFCRGSRTAAATHALFFNAILLQCPGHCHWLCLVGKRTASPL